MYNNKTAKDNKCNNYRGKNSVEQGEEPTTIGSNEVKR